MSPNWNVVDIGGHIGIFSIFMSKKVPLGKIYVYEPFPENFSLLEENVKLNNCSNIVLSNKAVCGEKGKRIIFKSAKNSGGHSLYTQEGRRDEIDCTTLEDILKSNGLSFVDFLKMDCEGAEYEIIRETPKEIMRSIKFIALEYHFKAQYPNLPDSSEELVRQLEEIFFIKFPDHQTIHAKNKMCK